MSEPELTLAAAYAEFEQTLDELDAPPSLRKSVRIAFYVGATRMMQLYEAASHGDSEIEFAHLVAGWMDELSSFWQETEHDLDNSPKAES
jgi:hypothetical protein